MNNYTGNHGEPQRTTETKSSYLCGSLCLLRVTLCKIFILSALFAAGAVRAESTAGIIRIDVGAEGGAQVAVPYHPFGEGRIGDVLRGGFTGGTNWENSDSASVWIAQTMSWLNGWFGTDGKWHGLEDHRFAAGDAFHFNNRAPAPLAFFIGGTVPRDDEIATVVHPGLNLISSPYPQTVKYAGREYPLGSGFWLLHEESGAATLPWRRPFNITEPPEEVAKPKPADTNAAPRIVGIEYSAGAQVPEIAIEGGGRNVGVFTLTVRRDARRNARRDGAFTTESWIREAVVATPEEGALSWPDAGFADFIADAGNAARFYFVCLSPEIAGAVEEEDKTPRRPDSAGDGIPDWWKISRGLDPLVRDNGAFSSIDGLSNLERYLYGVGPWDPAFTGTPRTVLTIRPPDADVFTGEWERTDDALICKLRSGGCAKGSVAFTNDLTITAPGIYQIVVRGRKTYTRPAYLGCEVAGVSLGVANLAPMNNTDSSVAFYTQWLQAGTHELVLRFDNVFIEVRFELHSIDINTFADTGWVQTRLAANAIRRGGNLPPVIRSKVSPYCMTGTAAFFSLVEVSTKTPIKPLPRKGWWTNIPLDSSSATPVTISYEHGARVENVSIEWVPFIPFFENDTTIRAGDTLLLGAHPEFDTELKINNLTVIPLTAGRTFHFYAYKPGEYKISARCVDASGQTLTATLTLTAATGVKLPDSVPAWQGVRTTAFLPDVFFDAYDAKTFALDSDLPTTTADFNIQGETEIYLYGSAPRVGNQHCFLDAYHDGNLIGTSR